MTHVSEERLLRFMDGDLSEAAAGEIAAHLSECERCRQVLSDYLEIEQALSVMPALRLAPVESRRAPARPRHWRLGLVAAALVAALGASWGLQVAGYWRAEQSERAAMRRDHYALVSAEASLLREATPR
ncbi:MAG: anti-sigma factor family protein [Chitinophagales bacterium]